MLAWVVALACAITAHHSGMALSGKHHGMDGGSVVELCLGVFTAVGAAVAAIALGSIALAARRVAVRLRPAVAVLPGPPPLPRARADPLVLCVIRR